MMKNNVLKVFVCLHLLLGFGASVYAQNNTIKEKMNSIKKDLFYLYAEATMEDEQEAKQLAYELLMERVNEYIASKKKLNDANRVLVKDIASKSESLSLLRGTTMHRVFVYVKKSDIEPSSNVIEIVKENQPETDKTGDVTVQQPASVVIPAKQEVVSQEDVAKDLTDSDNAVKEQVESSLPKWQQDVVDKLLSCGSITEVRSHLARMKSATKIKQFGAPANCKDAAKSFWVIFADDDTPLAILGDGEDKRINYRTMTYSSLNDFKGKNAIWFKFSK